MCKILLRCVLINYAPFDCRLTRKQGPADSVRHSSIAAWQIFRSASLSDTSWQPDQRKSTAYTHAKQLRDWITLESIKASHVSLLLKLFQSLTILCFCSCFACIAVCLYCSIVFRWIKVVHKPATYKIIIIALIFFTELHNSEAVRERFFAIKFVNVCWAYRFFRY